MHSRTIQNEALLLLEGRGRILEVARRVSQVMRDAGLDGAVIGGVAVVLHGYVRTTTDVDVYTPDAHLLGELLVEHGAEFDSQRREFLWKRVPVHLVTSDQVSTAPKTFVELDGVRSVSLMDLINMKLRSGQANIVRAIDLADVIGLIRHHGMTGKFAAAIDRDLRSTFRQMLKAVQADVRNRPLPRRSREVK